MLVEGVVRHYAWGDQRAIPAILGRPPDGQPWAEYWLGTHPGGPSRVVADGLLAEVAGELPYLLKLLAAAEPLSLQTHPSQRQAIDGYAREDAAGIAVDDPQRIYKDRSPKPELLVALTRFEALCGFTTLRRAAQRARALGAGGLEDALLHGGLERATRELYERRIEIAPIIDAAAAHPSREAQLVSRLAARYPDDPSVVVTLLLNLVTLRPGQAIFLAPGNLHAYLSGTGVEVMAASDNVVRGGLTAKHVDVPELLRVLDIATLADPVVRPVETAPGVWTYQTADAPFRVSRHEAGGIRTAATRELVLCTAGDAGDLRQGECAYLAPGESIELARATVFTVSEAVPAA